MKRHLVTIVSIAVVLAVAWVSFGQREGERSERGGGRRRGGVRREEQLKAIAAVEEELGKIKTGLESFSGVRGSWQDLSDEERDELRDKFREVRREQQQSVAVIEEQIPKLKGGRQLREEHEKSIGKLKAIRELAVKEKAAETAASIEELIAEQQKKFEDSLQSERGQRSEGQTSRTRAGRKAPAFELKSFDGKTISISDYKGKIVVLEWFNDECPFVQYHYEKTNTMIDLAQKYKDKGAIWLAVNSTGHATVEQNQDFSKKHKLVYPILDDRQGRVGRAYGAKTTPHMYVIDTEGYIVYEGGIDNSPLGRRKEGVVNYVDKALAELTAGKAISTAKAEPYGCTVKYVR